MLPKSFIVFLLCFFTFNVAEATKSCMPKTVNASEGERVKLSCVITIENLKYIKIIQKLRSRLTWNYSNDKNRELNFRSSINTVSEHLAFITSNVTIPAARKLYDEGRYTCKISLPYHPHLFDEECFDLQIEELRPILGDCTPEIAEASEGKLVMVSDTITIQNHRNIKNIEKLRSGLTWSYSGEDNRPLNFSSYVRIISEDLAFINSTITILSAKKLYDEGIYTLKLNGPNLFGESCFDLRINDRDSDLFLHSVLACCTTIFLLNYVVTIFSTHIHAISKICLQKTRDVFTWFVQTIFTNISNFDIVEERIALIRILRTEPAQRDVETEEQNDVEFMSLIEGNHRLFTSHLRLRNKFEIVIYMIFVLTACIFVYILL